MGITGACSRDAASAKVQDKAVGKAYHLAPPDIRIFFPTSRVLSKTVTWHTSATCARFPPTLVKNDDDVTNAQVQALSIVTSAPSEAAKNAAVRPAAPPPTTVTVGAGVW